MERNKQTRNKMQGCDGKKETETLLKQQVNNVKLHATAYRQNAQICYRAHVRTSPLLLKYNCDTTSVTMGATEHLKMSWLKKEDKIMAEHNPRAHLLRMALFGLCQMVKDRDSPSSSILQIMPSTSDPSVPWLKTHQTRTCLLRN